MKRFLLVLLSMVVSFVMMGCSGDDSATPRRSASIKIGFHSATMNHAPGFGPKFASVVVGAIDEVASVTVDIQTGGEFIVQGAPLSYNNGTWGATINDLPVGEQLTILAHAYNGSGQEIFTGETLQTLTGSGDQVDIILAPVSSGATLDFPGISQISRPAEILVSSASFVSFSIQGSPGETLSYEIIAAPNGGAFSPSSGSIILAGTSATLVVDFTAPASLGNYTHSIRVTNSLGNFVETTFNTRIAVQLAQNAISVLFNPVVTNMAAVRSGSNVTVTAAVSDTEPSNELVYDWSFSGSDGYAFSDSTVNPAVLNGSNSLFFGTLGLTVTSGSGRSTSVSYKLAFPKVSSVLVLPQARSTTGVGDCRTGAVSGNIIALAMDELGEDYNNDGDMSDRVLGYLDVTQGTVVNTGISIGNSVAIDGDIIAFRYRNAWNGYGYVEGTLGYYSISTQTAYDTGITPDGFGRHTDGTSRQVSNGKIAYIKDTELHIYDTAIQADAPTGVLNAGTSSNQPSFRGNIVAFTDSQSASQNGHLKYYDVTTGQTEDTHVQGTYPTVDNGIIVFYHASGKVAYYDIASQKNVITPLPAQHNNGSPSISNGIITSTIEEDETWGDLDGSGILGDDDQGILVLYDIPTGRMISTGLKLCCGADISGDRVAFEQDENTVNEDLNGDGVIGYGSGAIRDYCTQVYFTINDVVKQYFGRPIG